MDKTMVRSPSLHRPRLLVVADDLLLSQALRTVLSPQFELTLERSIVGAASLLSEAAPRFDAVLCEVELSDGMATDLLPALEPWRDRLAFLTGLSVHLPAVRRLDEAGFSVWSKPLHLDGLRALLDQLTATDRPPAQAA